MAPELKKIVGHANAIHLEQIGESGPETFPLMCVARQVVKALGSSGRKRSPIYFSVSCQGQGSQFNKGLRQHIRAAPYGAR